jgi:hypothetical protein
MTDWEAHWQFWRYAPGAGLALLLSLFCLLLALLFLARALRRAARKAAESFFMGKRFWRLSRERLRAHPEEKAAAVRDEIRDAMRQLGIRSRREDSVAKALLACAACLALAAGLAFFYLAVFICRPLYGATREVLLLARVHEEFEAFTVKLRHGEEIAVKPSSIRFRHNEENGTPSAFGAESIYLRARVEHHAMSGFWQWFGIGPWHHLRRLEWFANDPDAASGAEGIFFMDFPDRNLPAKIRRAMEKTLGGETSFRVSETLPFNGEARDLAFDGERYYWRYAEASADSR